MFRLDSNWNGWFKPECDVSRDFVAAPFEFQPPGMDGPSVLRGLL
jgi:hypothetical protein